MKYSGWFLLTACLAAGCGKSDSTAPAATPSAASSAPAPVAYVATAVQNEKKMIKTIDLTSLNHEVDLFNTQEGRYPKDLNELVSMHYLGEVPTPPTGQKLVYDAAQGKVTMVPQ